MDNDKRAQVISEILTVFYNHKLTFKQAYIALDDVKKALLENLLDTLSGQYPDIPRGDLIRLVADALNAPGVYRKICAEIDQVKKEGDGPASG